MKTRKINKKNGLNTVATIGGVVLGVMLGGAGSAVVNNVNPNLRTPARIAMGAGGAYAAVSVKSGDPLSNLAQGAGIGLAVREVVGLTNDAAKKMYTPKNDGSVVDAAISGAIGLAGAPCGCGDYNNPALVNGLGNAMLIEQVWKDNGSSAAALPSNNTGRVSASAI